MRPMARIMAVDVGSVRVGLALSDALGITAGPYRTLERQGVRKTAAEIAALAVAEEVGLIVVGLPLSMEGGEQESSRDARAVARALEAASELSVRMWDERLPSAQAERALIQGNLRREKRKRVVDQVAAAILLQSFLDSGAATSDDPVPAEPKQVEEVEEE